MSLASREGRYHPSRSRRILHAARDRLKKMGGGDVAGAAYEAGMQGAGWASVHYSIATAGAATVTGAAAVFTAPAFGATLAAIGVIKMAVDAYSDREAAHERLRPFVYSFLTDVPPQPIQSDQDREAAASAALYLVMNGQAQAELGAGKLQQVGREVGLYMGQVNRYLSAANGAQDDDRKIGYLRQIERDRIRMEMDGGPIDEWVRRLSHYANYLQMYDILARNMSGRTGQIPDFADRYPNVAVIRERVAEYDRNMEAFEELRNPPTPRRPPPVPPRRPPPPPPRGVRRPLPPIPVRR